MSLIVLLQSASDQCRGSFKQWLTNPPDDFNWGQCLQLFLDNSLGAIYGDSGKKIQAQMKVSYVDKSSLNLTYFDSADITRKCPQIAGDNAVNVLQGSACANCENQNLYFSLGKLSRVFLDVYAVNNYYDQLDVDLMQNSNFVRFLNSECRRIKSLTLRDILLDNVNVSTSLFGNFVTNSSKFKAPGVLKVLKKCQLGSGGDSLNQEALKTAALMALGGFTDESSFLSDLKLQYNQYNIKMQYMSGADDFSGLQFAKSGDTDGNIGNKVLKRYTQQPQTPLPALNAYIQPQSMQNLLNLVLLSGNAFELDGESKADINSSQQQFYCQTPLNTKSVSNSAVNALFRPQKAEFQKDATATQKLLGFDQINVQGTKFSTISGARDGQFSGIAYYTDPSNFTVSFSLFADVSDDQLFYEALSFIKSFFVEKSRDFAFRNSFQQLKGQEMLPLAIPEKGFTGQFLKLFSKFKMDDLVIYRQQLAAPRQNRPISVDFAVYDQLLKTTHGDYQYDVKSTAISFFVLCGFSLVFTIAYVIIGFFKRDQNKATNLYETALILPADLRKRFSKSYRQKGFWWFTKRANQQIQQDGLEQSSDDDFDAVQQKSAGQKFKLSVNTCNIVNYYLGLVKLVLLVLLLVTTIISLFITAKNTNVMQIAVAGSMLWTNMIYSFSWCWLILFTVQIVDNIYVLCFNVCSVTWSWIVLQLGGFCVDMSLLVYLAQMNLLTNVGGGSQNW